MTLKFQALMFHMINNVSNNRMSRKQNVWASPKVIPNIHSYTLCMYIGIHGDITASYSVDVFLLLQQHTYIQKYVRMNV